MPSDPCPSISRLEEHLSQPDPDPEIQRHINSCSACTELFDSITENNALFNRLLTASAGAQLGTEPDLARLAPPGYEVLGEIHRGGQGVVFSAIQTSTKRAVAIKTLLQGSFATSRQRWRFEREIETVARLRHPGIVTVFESGVTAEGLAYYSMELVEGVPLDSTLDSVHDDAVTGSGLISHKLRLFMDVCDAVAYAHRHGVIHRDLKPGNILVDSEGKPHVLDFGVAKALDDDGSERTLAGEFMGTLAFAAPEQMTGDPSDIDTRADVYSLGVILFVLLTGRRPFVSRGSLADAIHAVTDEPAPAPSTVAPEIAHDLDAIVLLALMKDPGCRYQSVADLADDVHRYLRGEPIRAKQDRTWYVLRKLARRYAVPLGLGVAAIVLLAGIAVAMTVLYERAHLEATKAHTMRIFLEDTLGSVPPAPDRTETTLHSVLDEAVQWVDIALSDQPEVAAAMRLTIGNSYRSLGLLDKAEEQVSMALDTRREVLGPRHLDTATGHNALALVFMEAGRYEEAGREFGEALAIRRDRLGATDLATAMVRMNMARLDRDRGDTDAARAALEECREIRRVRLGETHPDVAMCDYELAGLEESREVLNEAERLHRRALDARKAALNPGHPDLARSHHALGRVLAAQGRIDDAEKELLAAHVVLHDTFGSAHPLTAETRDTLIEFYLESNQPELAEPYLKQQ